MTPIHWLFVVFSATIGTVVSVFYKYYNPPEQEPIELPPLPVSQPAQSPGAHPDMPPVAPVSPVEAPLDPWSTPKGAWYAVRVLCDSAGLSLEDKNVICACIYQESQFYNYLPNGLPTKHDNGTSTDWGICQINDYWHVKKYHDFPSADFIMANPDKAVQFMINAFKGGGLTQWVSFSSGAYKQWLSPGSKMWLLAG